MDQSITHLIARMREIRRHGYRLLAAALLLAACNVAMAQQVRISVNFNKVPLKEALKTIESKCDYTFLYNEANIDANKKVSVKADNQQLSSILRAILGKTPWVVENKRIIIAPAPDKAAKASENKGAVKLVTGSVTDEKGEPMIGVSVTVPGTSTGTATNLDGLFNINAAQGQELRFSYIGYKPQTVIVGKSDNINVILAEDNNILDEVVVVGYGVQKKVNLSGSVATVNTKQLENRPVLSVGSALQGAVANLNVTTGSGQATSSPSFNIRGTTSLNGGSPLVVIDGVISTADVLNRMNPDDIANMSVLKDASSAAIYGSRAAYGVILVTTKSGDSEKLTVNYSNNFVWHTNTKLPDVITDPYIIATTRNTMSYPWYNLYNEEQLAYAKKVSEDPSTSPYYVNPDGTYSYFGHTDWYKEIFKKSSFAMIHNVSVSGKTEKVNYYLSGSYNKQDGMFRKGNDIYNRYNLRTKLDFKLTDWWTLGANLGYITSDYDYPMAMDNSIYRQTYRKNTMSMVYNEDGTYTSDATDNVGRLEKGGRSKDKNTDINVIASTRIDFIKDVLFVNGNFAYSNNRTRSNWFELPVPYKNGPDLPELYFNPVTYAASSEGETSRTSFDAYGTFTKKFFEKHSVLALAGFNQEEYRYDYFKANRKELISESLPTINLATGDMNMSQSITTWTTRGAFFRLNYTYDDKYILEFNGRYDGTSRFPKNDRFVFNPSGSAAWVVSKENFFEPIRSVVNFFKIFGSYGRLGNQDVGAYAYLATMGSGKISQILDGKQPVYVGAPGLVSGSLTWEKVTTGNIGADINFLNNRLTLTGEYYERRTKDMLTKGMTLPGVLGTSVPQENAADLKTKGWELTINWHDQFQLASRPFNYSLSFNIADSRAWITKFDNPTGSLSDYYNGYEMGTIWGLETEGFFTSQEDIDNHADQSWSTSYPGTRPLEPGDLKFKDINGDGKIDRGNWTLEDHGDFKIIGNSRNRYTFGINASATWNGFDLSIFAQGVGKRKYYPGTDDLYFWGIYSQPWTNVTYGNYYDRWTEETPNGYFPRFKSYVAEQGSCEAGITQTRYLQNAAYIRLKNLTVGYTLPSQLLRKAGIQRLRIFFSGDNLCESSGLYKHYKIDPETLGSWTYPLQRSYSFGLNITL
ncbi:MAG: TonB-dependent receptor [Muribaculaceae bacterium]|nr:TonB-dependent receptor [Muribaculaceae bacterium]